LTFRYFYEECPELHVIAAGSLIEFSLGGISFPVGRVRILDMAPMTFAEFLAATGAGSAASMLLGETAPFPESVNEMLMDRLRRYFWVGGMPEAVSAYVESGSLQEAFAVQEDLLASIRQDFSKYAPHANIPCLEAAVASAAQGVGRQVKYARLSRDFDGKTVKRAFDLLCKARILTKVRAASPAGIPLEAHASEKVFKAIFLDVGLLQRMAGLRAGREMESGDLLGIYRGALAEQFVGQELLASQGGPLFYWSRSSRGSSAEVDYLLQHEGRIFPIEVKNGPAGRLKSLHMLLEKFPHCPAGIVLSGAPHAWMEERRILFLPLYFAGAPARQVTFRT